MSTGAPGLLCLFNIPLCFRRCFRPVAPRLCSRLQQQAGFTPMLLVLRSSPTTMIRQEQQQSGRGGFESRRMSIVLAVSAVLLSLGPTDSFLSAPLSSVGGSGAAGSTASSAAALRRSGGEGRSTTQRTAAARRGARRKGDGGAAVRRLSATGVVTEDNQGAVGSLLESQEKQVSNNDMKPFVAMPRRDPRVWFDAIKDGAPPRPEALVELSK